VRYEESMNLTRVTQIAEIISSIAVLATLVFLTFQIRDNTSATRSASYGSELDRLNSWRYEVSNNPESMRLFSEFLNEGAGNFDNRERQQFEFLNNALRGTYESAYYARSYDVLGESEWSRTEIAVCRQFVVTERHNYWERTTPFFTSDFKEYVELNCI